MAPTADQIRANLTEFAARWDIGDWGERQEAQTFVNGEVSDFLILVSSDGLE